MTLVAEILAIGDELIHGALLDTNSKYLAAELERIGCVVHRFSVTSDDPDHLRSAWSMRARAPMWWSRPVGSGRRSTIARATWSPNCSAGRCGSTPRAGTQIQDYLGKRRGRQVPESNKRQAMLPPGGRADPEPGRHGTWLRRHASAARASSQCPACRARCTCWRE
jgi:nicotinamide-nucleotide amidase